jgi:hypothetical protein
VAKIMLLVPACKKTQVCVTRVGSVESDDGLLGLEARKERVRDKSTLTRGSSICLVQYLQAQRYGDDYRL